MKIRRKPRRGPLRNREYLDFLKREGNCVACQVLPRPFGLHFIDPCHGPVNGISSKGPDHEAIPLCRSHHEEQTDLGWPQFCLRYNIDRPYQVKLWNTLYLAWKGNGKKWELPA